MTTAPSTGTYAPKFLIEDAEVPIEFVSRIMRHASTLTTEHYCCRARADLAFARVNDAFNSVFRHEPAVAEKND